MASKPLPDRYMTAAEKAQQHLRDVAYGLPRAETPNALNEGEQQAMFDKHYRPLLDKGDMVGAMKLVASQAPVGSDYERELARLMVRFGGRR